MRRGCVLATVLGLAACAEPVPAPVQSGLSPRPIAPVTSSPTPVTQFDGRYAGTITLNPDRTRACPAAPDSEREMTVRGGRAALALNPETRLVLNGTVGPGGDVRLVDRVDRTIATSGLFTGAGFRGEHRSGLCSYAVLLSKRE